jgi:hypothetical protein
MFMFAIGLKLFSSCEPIDDHFYRPKLRHGKHRLLDIGLRRSVVDCRFDDEEIPGELMVLISSCRRQA